MTMGKIFVLLSNITIYFVLKCVDSHNIDVEKVKISGPGTRPDAIVMPARYFFIYLTDALKERYNPSLAKSVKVEVTGVNIHKRDCRVWVNLLDRKDGSFVARYKLYETCYSMKIEVTFEGNHIGGSPFIIKEPAQADDCNCPFPMDKWIKENECPASYKQIEKDLKPFATVNLSSFHQHVVNKVDKSGSMSVCNYVILDNQIYRKCYGQHVGFKMFVDSILTSLARRLMLPDCEFFVNLGDWPLARKDAEVVFPMFSWCGSDHTMDIVLPTYDITESSLEMMGRVSLDMLSVQGNIDRPWEEKESKAFWRGRDSSRERLLLMDIAKDHPDLFNVFLTNYFFFREQEKIHGKGQHISFFKFFEYKYQLCLDGTVAAYRMPYLLVGDGLVLKQDSDYYEYFYSDLKPWVHFVPVKRDLSDLVEKVIWARDNDHEAKKIMLAGQKYARENLLPQNVFCYHVMLLKEWSRRLVERVKVREGMEKVSQPDKNKACSCSGGPKHQHSDL